MVVVAGGGWVVVVTLGDSRRRCADRAGRHRRPYRRRHGGRGPTEGLTWSWSSSWRRSWSWSLGPLPLPAAWRTPGGREASGRLGRFACPVGRRCLPPAVATSNAMRPSDTARMTHQLGRPRATLERQPSGVSGPPPKRARGHDTHASRSAHPSVRRAGAADRGHAGRRGIGGRVRSARSAPQWNIPGRGGRRGPARRRVASPRRGAR